MLTTFASYTYGYSAYGVWPTSVVLKSEIKILKPKVKNLQLRQSY